MSVSADASAAPRELAVRLIGTLRQGSNSLEGVSLFSAGRETVMHAAETLMDDLSFSGGSAVRWLKGSYGSGKTHTFARLLEAAHARRWVVSYVQVSGKSQGCEMHRFEEVYAAIVRNCMSPDHATATQVLSKPGTEDGWQWMLDSWVEALKRQVGGRNGGDFPSLRFLEALDVTVSQLRRNYGIHGAFGAALRAYALAKLDYDFERLSILLEWFAGADVFKQGAQIKSVLREVGVLEVISRRNAKATLRQLTAFIRYRGYKGVLILFDEVENILQLTPGNRRIAYTLLRELIDNVDERHGMAQTLVYLSATPDLFEGQKGIAEYEALASRVILPSSLTPNPGAAVVDLAAFPVTREDLLTIGGRIATLYRAARPGGSITTTASEADFASILPTGALPSPRLWVRMVVDLLDRTTLFTS